MRKNYISFRINNDQSLILQTKILLTFCKLAPKDYFWRKIKLLTCLCKFFTNMLNSRLVEVCKKEKLIHVSQIGFKEGHRTTDHLFSLKTLINNSTTGAQRGHNQLYACFIDFKKAYDSVWHDGLFSKLESLNITGNFLAIIKSMYKNSYCAVKVQTKITIFFKCEKGVRQGCPLSPILFNIFINNLTFDLDKMNSSAVELPNGSFISCLMYADDVILISKTPNGLQKLLDCVNMFCKTLKMMVNPIKTKCITFTRKNKINKKDIFSIREHYVENVSQVNYLGLEINAAGSFKTSMDLLCIIANKAKYALNNIIKLKNLPVKVALRLFDAVVLPILTYGLEIWALNSTLDHEKWDRSSTERAHLDFLRHILGVNRSVNNLLCRAEVGKFPINIEINYKIINFYNLIRDLPEHNIAHQTYIMDNEAKGLSKLYTCNQHITNLKNITTSGILDLNKRSVKKILRNSYEIIWKEKIKTSTRGIYFSKFKQNIDYESYLVHNNQRSIRRSLSKLTISE